MLMREKIIKAIDNERKRYSKDMKGTEGRRGRKLSLLFY